MRAALPLTTSTICQLQILPRWGNASNPPRSFPMNSPALNSLQQISEITEILYFMQLLHRLHSFSLLLKKNQFATVLVDNGNKPA